MNSISFSKFVVIFFLILLIFGDFSSLISKIKPYFEVKKKKSRKKGS